MVTSVNLTTQPILMMNVKSYQHKIPKMPVLQTSVYKGQTLLLNMDDVAAAIGVDAEYPTKFLGFELNKRTHLRPDVNRNIGGPKKTYAHQHFALWGHHDADRIHNLLNEYIETFVLCSLCHSHQSRITKVQRRNGGGELDKLCGCCGFSQILDPSHHKLNHYMIQHPPTIRIDTADHHQKHRQPLALPVRKHKQQKKIAQTRPFALMHDDDDDDDHDDDDDDGLKTGSYHFGNADDDDEGVASGIKVNNDLNDGFDDGDVADVDDEFDDDTTDWSCDFSQEAVARRLSDNSPTTLLTFLGCPLLPSGIPISVDTLTTTTTTTTTPAAAISGTTTQIASISTTKTLSERLSLFDAFVQGTFTNAAIFDTVPSAAKVVAEAQRLEVCDHAARAILRELPRETDAELLESVASHVELLTALASPKCLGQSAQHAMLNAIEKLVESQPQLLSKVDKLCKTFYDLDILDEDTFLEWEDIDPNTVTHNNANDTDHDHDHDHANSSVTSEAIVDRRLHGSIIARSEFLKWLRTAEEEDDDEVHDDEEMTTDIDHDQVSITSSSSAITTLSSRTHNCSQSERDMS